MQQLEAKRFEDNKAKAADLHQQLRLEEVDFWITKHKKEPLKLQRLRTKVVKLESEQESQRSYFRK